MNFHTTLSIHEVAALSGLSKPQIEQAISRWLITPHAQTRPGHARQFTRADAFLFCIVAEALRVGLAWPAIRDIVMSLPLPGVDPDTFCQRDIFPGFRGSTDVVLVATGFDPEALPTVRLIERADLAKIGSEAALVLPATQIARVIEAYEGE